MTPLVVTIHHKDQVLHREVSKASFTVGRSLDCDIHLNDTSISRIHIVVTQRGNKIFIEDKNSSNGTFVDGEEITRSVPFPVGPKDKIQIGNSEYFLTVSTSLAGQEKEEEEEEERLEHTKDMPPPVVPEPPPAKAVAPPTPASAASEPAVGKHSFLAEKALHDAKKRAAQIVIESEAQAERKVQAIYEKARKTQEQAEELYEKRLAEAHKEADNILADVQKQAQELMREARTLADNLREDVDSYIQSLRKKAKIEADEIVAEAQRQAEKQRAEAVELGKEEGKKDSESLVTLAREEAAKILEKAQLQGKEIQEKLITDRESLEKLTEEVAEKEKQLSAHKEELAALTKTEAELAEKVKNEEAEVAQLREAEKTLLEQKKSLDESMGQLQDRHAKLSAAVQDLEAKRAQLLKEAENQKVLLAEKFEKERAEMLKQEEERSEELRLEFAKKMQKMEQDLIDDVIRRKSSLVREIHGTVEKEVVQIVDASKWRKISPTVEQRINEAFDGKVASISQASASTQKPVDLLKKRSEENMRWAAGGLAAGLALFFAAQTVMERVRKDQTPMLTRVKNEAQQRKQELEARRFNPPQTDELKDTYVDAVIYTRQFVEIYTDEDYQQRLYKAASQYLLKTWRLEEEKTLQVLAASNALVKELVEKKSKIHPDFVKEGLEKMHKLEAETLGRMKDILGSEVRLESFRRFEKEFYQEELQRRKVAQH